MIRIFITLFLCFSSFIYSFPTTMRRVYFGPDFCYQSFHENQTPATKVKEYGYMTKYQFGYEKFGAFSLYFAFDICKTKAKTIHLNELFTMKTKTKNDLVNYEGRLGFSIPFAGRLLLTPFFGFGYHSWERKTHEDEIDDKSKYKYEWYYKGYGLSLYVFLTNGFDIEFRGKMMLPSDTEVSIDKGGSYTDLFTYLWQDWPSLSLKNKIQYQIEMPMYYHPTIISPFEIIFIPYYKNIEIGKATTKESVTKKPIYPGSTTYDIGLKLLLALKF